MRCCDHCRPSRSLGLPRFRYRTCTHWLCSLRARGAAPGGLDIPFLGGSHLLSSTEAAVPPRFLGNPLVRVPCSRTPPGPPRFSRLLSVGMLPSATVRRRTPELPVSRLHRMARVLPVYASRPGSPLSRARLGSGGRQLCRVGLVTHRVPMKGFGYVSHGVLLSQAYPGAPQLWTLARPGLQKP